MENKGIYVLENFLSEKECDEILNIVKNMYKKIWNKLSNRLKEKIR